MNADATVATTKTAIPALSAQAQTEASVLATLLGAAPGRIDAELRNPVNRNSETLPEFPIGLPSDLLKRRPDIQRSVSQLHAETARVGVAVADLFPKFSPTSFIRIAGDPLAIIKDLQNNMWTLGASAVAPLFRGGSLDAGVSIAEARGDERLAAYKQSILTALQETNSALISYRSERERMISLDKGVTAN